MDFFVDSAHIEEIRQAVAWGLCDGVTTNPSLVAKTGKSFEDVITEILEIVDGPISLEATATDYEGMLAQAKDLASRSDKVVVKLPMTPAGIQTTRACSQEGIKTNVTLVFSPTQALLAAKAGATYVSPFIGRLDDISSSGMTLIEDLVQIFSNYAFGTRILVASVRHPEHVVDSARLGAHVCTIPFDVLKRFFSHPLTDIGLEKFLKDWEKVPDAS